MVMVHRQGPDDLYKREVLISDRAKGLETDEVLSWVADHGEFIEHTICAWHLLVKNLNARGGCSDEDRQMLWKIVYETNFEKGERLLAELETMNKALYTWFLPSRHRVCR